MSSSTNNQVRISKEDNKCRLPNKYYVIPSKLNAIVKYLQDNILDIEKTHISLYINGIKLVQT